MANAILAAIISFFIPGVGQMYAGRLKRGIIILVVAILLLFLIGGGTFFLRSLIMSIPGLLCLIFAIWSAVDAYMLASANKTFLVPDFIK